MSDSEPIELRDFIAASLTQIIEGVSIAQQNAARWNGRRELLTSATINPSHFQSSKAKEQALLALERYVTIVNFDLQLGSTKSRSGGFSIGVVLGALGIGGKVQDNDGRTATTRVKFEVPMVLPAQLPPTQYLDDSIPQP